jgi:N-acetyl-gamma-glutamyl-phosphate reductase
VANPGCYATGAIALLRPLVDADLLPADTPLVITGVSGYTGGGRAMIAAFEGRGPAPVDDPYQAYALELAHKHTPEIAVHAGLARKPLFTPAVGRFAQGMLVTVPLTLWSIPGRPSGKALHAALAAHYAGAAHVTVLPFDVRPKTLAPDTLNGTDDLELFVFDNPAEQTALLVARLDNLGKGAAGAAVQNIDLMLGR